MRSSISIALVVVAIVLAVLLFVGGLTRIIMVATEASWRGASVLDFLSALAQAAFWVVAALFLFSKVGSRGSTGGSLSAVSTLLVVSGAIFAVTLLGTGAMALITGFTTNPTIGLFKVQATVNAVSGWAAAAYWVLLAFTLVMLLEGKARSGSGEVPVVSSSSHPPLTGPPA
ncbi:MAG: hypothetical protein KKF41_12190 [Actinobacteria bacterium]|nr:hypothetical protein [Actinomycetota bacterium]MBU1945068.1 hypothetical protein [Actinomycetota bacterium]MBU2688336.1 hypothetical protein [Actinomycetota bacterium]